MQFPSDNFLKTSSVILAVVGILTIVYAVAADSFSPGGWPGIGLGQILLAIAGGCLLLIAVGLRTGSGRQCTRKLMHSPLPLVIIGFLLGLLIAEGGIRAWTGYKSRQLDLFFKDDHGIAIQALHNPLLDPKLGLRMAPNSGGHDARGWRNDAVPKQVDVVAIGDSQTWGVNVDSSSAWPQTLARISGQMVYNMALGYYGTVRYWVLIDEALELEPKVIVIGLYLGNDLHGAYNTIYLTDMYPQFRDPKAGDELFENTIDPQVRATVQEIESFQQQHAEFKLHNLFTQFLPRYSMLIRTLQERGLWLTEPSYEIDKAWALTYPNQGSVFELEGVRTVFNTGYRLLALDLDDPRIKEGLRITKDMVLKAQAQTDETSTQLIVLLIPTKQLVYADAVQAARGGELDPMFFRLVSMEEQARAEIIHFFQLHDIKYTDALPAMREAVLRGEQIYPEGLEDHPIERGYYYLASAVHDALSSME